MQAIYKKLILLFLLLPAMVSAQDHLPGVVIAKVKPQYQTYCTAGSIEIAGLQSLMQNHAVKGVSKMFPLHKAPVMSHDRYGNKLVDISLIYQINCESGKEQDVITMLQRSGYFEYAESWPLVYPAFVPNDPLVTQQYSLSIMNVFNAWDVSTGDTSIVIGITDTGADMDHQDLAGNIHKNHADPVNGIDDDGDGYTDNYNGWDLGENDNDPSSNANHHGVHVSGISSAVVNNSTGVAGVAYRCRFMPVKISNASGLLTQAYQGIVYAADQGCRIINCSWGSTSGGSFGQDIVNYATFNQGALVVCGAGNNSNDVKFYPAAFRNAVAVAGTNSADKRYSASNYGTWIDVSAPGEGVYSTWDGNNYSPSSGTSMAAPNVAGAAALVATVFPSYTPLQIAEQLRVTTDDLNAGNPTYANLLGSGRINLFDALTQSGSPSVRIISERITDGKGNNLTPGDTAFIGLTFRNYLAPSPALSVTLTETSPFITILDGTTGLPPLSTMDTINTDNDRFRLLLTGNPPRNQQVTLKVEVSGPGYSSVEYLELYINRDYYNVTINEISTTVCGNGRIGYYDAQQLQGLGFAYRGENLLYEAGFMVGRSPNQVSDPVRGTSVIEEDFYSYIPVHRKPYGGSDLDLFSWFNDYGPTSENGMGLDVLQRAYAWDDTLMTRFVILRYEIVNNGTKQAIWENLHAGIFADWDIVNYSTNAMQTVAGENLAYVYHPSLSTAPWVGIKYLDGPGTFRHFAMDNNLVTAGVTLADGFSDAEKYIALTTSNPSQGTGVAADVSHVVSCGPFILGQGDTAVVAFALIAGDSLQDLIASGQMAQSAYNTRPLSTPEQETKKITLYPNPAGDLVFIRGLESGMTAYRVIDISGRVVRSGNTGTAAPARIDLSGIRAGYYLITVVDGHNREHVSPLLIQSFTGN